MFVSSSCPEDFLIVEGLPVFLGPSFPSATVYGGFHYLGL